MVRDEHPRHAEFGLSLDVNRQVSPLTAGC